MSGGPWGELDADTARALTGAWPTPVLLVGHDGHVIAASAAMESLCGVRHAALIGAHVARLLPAFDGAISWEKWFLELGSSSLETLHAVRHVAGLRTSRVAAYRFGERAILVLRDVTDERTESYLNGRRLGDTVAKQRAGDDERAKLEAELRESNRDLAQALKLRDEFLASTSHELRTPLHTILGLVETVLEGAFGAVSEGVQRPLRAALEAAHQQLGYINGILDLTKLEGGSSELRRELCLASRVALDAVELVKAKAQGAQVELSIEVGADCTIDVDRHRFTRALLELIDNAIKYTPAGGQVRVSAMPEEDTLVFAVEDTGVGIDERDRQGIFQPFVQVDGSLSRAKNGLGLGLALVDRVVALHGARLECTSTVGSGSRFSIHVPISSQPAGTSILSPSLRARSTPSNLAGLRVVLTGKHAELDAYRDLMELRGADAHVLSVESSLERLAAAGPIDIVVLAASVSPEDLARVVLTVRTHGYGSRVAVLAFGAQPAFPGSGSWASAGVEAWLEPEMDGRVFLQVAAREHRRRSVLLAPPA